MSASDSHANLSLATLKRLDAVCAAYEKAWRPDQPPAFAEFLANTAEPERSVVFRELLKLEAELRQRAGVDMPTEEIARRYPEYAEFVTEFLGRRVPFSESVSGASGKGTSPHDTPTVAGTQPEQSRPDDLAFLEPSDKPGTIGRLGHYEIQGVVGRGGMGVVLRAFDEKLHRIVAIKILGPQFSTNATARLRFEREARSAAAVSHDHIISIYQVDEVNGVPFLVMPLIVGKSLQERLDESGPLELRAILRIGNQIAEGLSAAHRKGLVHRDIKPANILLENGVERVKITDFGLARAVDDATVTQSGLIAGTPMYMAPEQAGNEHVDHRADLFSLGSVLYTMCTGRPPFRATGTIAVMMRVIEDTPRPIREVNPDIPDWLCDIIAKLHAKKPDDRFQTAREVAELLEQHLAHLQQPHVAPKPAAVFIPAATRNDGGLRPPLEAQQPWPVWPIALLGVLLVLLAPVVFVLFGMETIPIVGAIALVYVVALYLWLKQQPTSAGGEVRAGPRSLLPVALVGLFVLIVAGLLLFLLSAKHGESPFWQWATAPILMVGVVGILCAFWLYLRLQPRQRLPARPEQFAQELQPTRWWVHLAKSVAAYGLFLLVFLLIAGGLSDAGVWANPVIEWWTLGILGCLILWHLWQATRRRQPFWLLPIPVLLAGFIVLFAIVSWPYYTAMHFQNLMKQQRYREAALMTPAVARWSIHNGLPIIRSVNSDSIGVAELDLPFKFDISEAWDRHLSRDEFGDQLVFSFKSQGQKYYRVNMIALRGSLHCESITFHGMENRSITREEWEERVAGNVVGHAGRPPATAVAPFDAAQANLHQLAWTRHVGGPVTLTNSIGTKLRVIPPGEFLMDGNKVRITKPFRIGIHEVTVAQFRQFVEETGHKTEAEVDGKGGFNNNWQQRPEYNWQHREFARDTNQPAVFLAWNDAVKFCAWLSEKEKKTYRLPTEAEWEWACRAGSMGTYHFGDDADRLNDHAWYGGNSGTSHPVGQKKPNAWGLFDMHGNAAEFCSDWSAPLPAGERVDPKGPAEGEFRVVRGGGFHDARVATTCSQRGAAAPKLAMMHFGLRLVLEESITPRGKLPESADDVLPTMVGAWRAQITHKIINGQPTKFRTEGYADIRWVAGKRFLHMREQVGPAGANFVQVFSFDPKTGDFRNTHFDATGMVMGPTTSRWDSRTHTLTGTSKPDAAGLMVKNTRFIDADTMEWEAIVRDKTGKTIFETYAKLTRVAGPAKINEDEAPVPVPAETAVLHKLVGDWQTTHVQKAPVQSAKSRHTAAKVLGGRFVSFQELDLPSSEEHFGIMTYDVPSEKYRLWNFARSGQIQEFQGVWNDAAQRLTWHRIEPDGSAHYRILDWRGPDEYKQTIQSRNKSGGLLSELELTTRRQSKGADGWAPFFSGSDTTPMKE